jgi:hypothetical protein
MCNFNVGAYQALQRQALVDPLMSRENTEAVLGIVDELANEHFAKTGCTCWIEARKVAEAGPVARMA